MKTIAIASLKGGVGKTTIAAFLGQACAAAGKKTLLIDADPNNNLTDYFLRDADSAAIEAANLYQVFTDRATIAEAVHSTAFRLDVLPCTPSLHKVGVELATDPAALLRFGARLRKLDYEIIIIDTPPALTFEFRAALYAADLVLCPVALARWSDKALELLQDEIEKLAELKTPPALRAVPAIVTDSELLTLQFSKLKGILTKSGITRAASIKKAANRAAGLSSKSRQWAEFVALAKEVA
jgi:chromosome partitioning protein